MAKDQLGPGRGGGGGGTPYIYRVSHDNEGQFFAPHPMQMPMNSFCTTCCILTPLGSPISSILTLMISIDSNQVLAWGRYVILLSLPKFNLHPLELATILLCVGGGGGVRCTNHHHIFVNFCHQAHLGIRVEMGSDLSTDLGQPHPAHACTSDSGN